MPNSLEHRHTGISRNCSQESKLSVLTEPQGTINQDNSKDRVRNEMENGSTEVDGKCQSDLIEPQGIIKKWEM